ncbi:enzymatic polyprotein endonuclease reverse-like protein, partial [Dinothrombium tinctorium]
MAVMNKASPHCILGNDFNIKAGILMNFAHMKIGMVETQPQVNVILPGEETSTSELVDSRDKQAMKSESESCSSPYRVSPKERKIIKNTVDELLENDIIRPSFSPWASPVILVPKRGSDIPRTVVDYRKLNAVTTPRGSAHFASMDVFSMYYQIEVAEDKAKTAFVTPDGHYEFNRMSFGLQGAPATSAEAVKNILADMINVEIVVYFDDILVFARDFDQLLFRLQKVFERLKIHNLRLKPSKCEFAVDRVKFLGHEISLKGIEPDQERVIAIRGMKPPVDVKGIKSFLDADCISRHLAVDPGEDEDIDDIP